MSLRRKSPPGKHQTVAELRALQRLVATAVMRPLTPTRRMNPRWFDGSPSQQVVTRVIKPNDRLSSLERLELYNRQYWFRLLDCLFEDYPGLLSVLGMRKFSRLAREYLTACPSASFTMRNLGQFLVDFIQACPALVEPRYQLALDMARLEWAHVEAFDNAALPTLEDEDLHDADPRTLRLRLQPHLTLLQLDHEPDDFLIAVRRSQQGRHEASNAFGNSYHPSNQERAHRFARKPCHLAVHRYRDSVFYKRLKPAQFVLLSALHRRLPLERSVEQARKSHYPAIIQTSQIAHWCRDWAALGWFVAFDTKKPTENCKNT